VGQIADEVTASGLIAADCRVEGYLTTDVLSALWDERSRQVDLYRRENPGDVKGIDLRQRQAAAVLKAYRVLSTLEQQLGLHLALPVLGTRA